jgi:hypothetical protein
MLARPVDAIRRKGRILFGHSVSRVVDRLLDIQGDRKGCTMNDFPAGFLKGARETPRAFFAPAVAIWRLIYTVTESFLAPKARKD